MSAHDRIQFVHVWTQFWAQFIMTEIQVIDTFYAHKLFLCILIKKNA